MAAYFNENDPVAAEWLRRLIQAGLIADGEVDERSILDVRPADLRGFTQCHFFAGIGIWSHALRSAGWADTRPVWSGSCPCQPFSAAGKGLGLADERHLWPAWFDLIRECRPGVIFGEQVASKDALAWLDHVYADLEGEGFAVAAIDLCAAGFGAPHIRQRIYFCGVADTEGAGREHGFLLAGDGRPRTGSPRRHDELANVSPTHRMAGIERDAALARNGGHADGGQQLDGMGNAIDARPQGHGRPGEISVPAGWTGTGRHGAAPGATNGFWADAIWLPCRDGKARPTKPGLFPLAYGYPGRVGALRAAGNALVAPQAEEFVRAAIDALRELE